MFKVGDIVEITEESSATGMLDFIDGKGYAVLETALHTTNLTEPVKVYYLKIRVMNEGGVKGWYTASHFKLKEEANEGDNVEEKECLFKEGQVVWDLLKGKAVVEDVIVNIDYAYPIKVRYEDGDYAFYTHDGKLEPKDKYRRLFFSEPKIEAATEPLFEPVLKKGDWVVLSDNAAKAIVKVVNETDFELFYEGDGVVSGVFKNTVDVYRLGEKIKFN